MGRQGLLLALALLFLLGMGATVARLLEARRTGLSLRLQVFIPLAATTLFLSAMFAVIVIDRFTARASLFAFRAAEDEARAIAELAARTPRESLRPILAAFTRSAIDTDVSLLDDQGQVVLDAGEAHPGVARVSAEAPVAGGGRVRVRKATFGMVQLMSDVAPKVALLALMFAVASAALAILIGGAVAMPIERLTRAAKRVAAGERQAPLPEPRGREVRELTHALESMRRELEERDAQGPTADARKVRVELRAGSAAPVRGDPIWLRRALENLLGNAVQHSPEGEKVELEISGGPECVAQVRDHGPGVDPVIRERLFERFATTRHGNGGTGLGLAIVRAVAELHGGRAELRETGPRGSVFALSLPRA